MALSHIKLKSHFQLLELNWVIEDYTTVVQISVAKSKCKWYVKVEANTATPLPDLMPLIVSTVTSYKLWHYPDTLRINGTHSPKPVMGNLPKEIKP